MIGYRIIVVWLIIYSFLFSVPQWNISSSDFNNSSNIHLLSYNLNTSNTDLISVLKSYGKFSYGTIIMFSGEVLQNEKYVEQIRTVSSDIDKVLIFLPVDPLSGLQNGGSLIAISFDRDMNDKDMIEKTNLFIEKMLLPSSSSQTLKIVENNGKYFINKTIKVEILNKKTIVIYKEVKSLPSFSVYTNNAIKYVENHRNSPFVFASFNKQKYIYSYYDNNKQQFYGTTNLIPISKYDKILEYKDLPFEKTDDTLFLFTGSINLFKKIIMNRKKDPHYIGYFPYIIFNKSIKANAENIVSLIMKTLGKKPNEYYQTINYEAFANDNKNVGYVLTVKGFDMFHLNTLIEKFHLIPTRKPYVADGGDQIIYYYENNRSIIWEVRELIFLYPDYYEINYDLAKDFRKNIVDFIKKKNVVLIVRNPLVIDGFMYTPFKKQSIIVLQNNGNFIVTNSEINQSYDYLSDAIISTFIDYNQWKKFYNLLLKNKDFLDYDALFSIYTSVRSGGLEKDHNGFQYVEELVKKTFPINDFLFSNMKASDTFYIYAKSENEAGVVWLIPRFVVPSYFYLLPSSSSEEERYYIGVISSNLSFISLDINE